MSRRTKIAAAVCCSAWFGVPLLPSNVRPWKELADRANRLSAHVPRYGFFTRMIRSHSTSSLSALPPYDGPSNFRETQACQVLAAPGS